MVLLQTKWRLRNTDKNNKTKQVKTQVAVRLSGPNELLGHIANLEVEQNNDGTTDTLSIQAKTNGNA